MNILFLGDSITDCDHCFTPDNLGNGYVKYLSALLPDCTLVNGGTDGFTFPRIYHKWKTMYQNRSFDIAVILGGINDISVLLETGLDIDQAKEYLNHSIGCLRKLLQELQDSGIHKLIVIEPFLFSEFGWTHAWHAELKKFCSLIREISQENCLLLSFSQSINNHLHLIPLSSDGVHLTMEGHQLLAQMLFTHLTE